jgi:hypothetical protein
MGFRHGISILGRSFSEPTPFKLAYPYYEQATLLGIAVHPEASRH